MSTTDHARELAENLHDAEEAVATTGERVSQAEVAVIAAAKALYMASGPACDGALRALQQACHGLEVAEQAWETALADRDGGPR